MIPKKEYRIQYIRFSGNKITLAKTVACFSKYHFHRIFSGYTGMSLRQMIRWLRLKRAAYQLIMDKEKPIINIAMDAGLESHESFSRVFKQAYCNI